MRPRCSHFLFKGYAFLLLKSSQEILLSREGVTQGDPLFMTFYAIATLPLVQALRGDGSWFQSWYADDSVCAGPLAGLFVVIGSLRYFPEPRKSYLMVAPHKVSLASDVLLVWGYLLSLVTPFLGVLLVSLNIVRS